MILFQLCKFKEKSFNMKIVLVFVMKNSCRWIRCIIVKGLKRFPVISFLSRTLSITTNQRSRFVSVSIFWHFFEFSFVLNSERLRWWRPLVLRHLSNRYLEYVWSTFGVTFYDEDCSHIHHADAWRAGSICGQLSSNTSVFFVSFSVALITGTAHNISLPVCLRKFSTVLIFNSAPLWKMFTCRQNWYMYMYVMPIKNIALASKFERSMYR